MSPSDIYQYVADVNTGLLTSAVNGGIGIRLKETGCEVSIKLYATTGAELPVNGVHRAKHCESSPHNDA